MTLTIRTKRTTTSCIYDSKLYMLQCVFIHNLVSKSHALNTCVPYQFLQSSKFHAAPGISKCRAHASLPFGRTYVHNFLYVLYLHWSPNPKCCLVPLKPSGPHIFKASARTRILRRGPAHHSTPTNPTAALIIGFLQEDEGEADLQWRRLKKGSVVETPTLGCPRQLPHASLFCLFFMLLCPRVK